MLLMIDNYDSFTYNLVQYLGELGQQVAVYRNDQIELKDIEVLEPEFIVISPGPCTPNEAGISESIVKTFGGKVPILGVCLGHQCIVQAYGGKIVHAGQLMHGKTSMIEHEGDGVFRDLPSPFQATRYHSLVAEASTVPDCLKVTARAEDGEIMGVQHERDRVVGLQFHPESILTQYGHHILKNFLEGRG
jgi:anthranilate synthase component 2